MKFGEALRWLSGMPTERRSRYQVLGPPRDPVVAEWFGLGGQTSAGVNITPANARECPEVDATVGLIEDTIGTVPLDLFERVSDDDRRKAVDHPLYGLLHDRPNSWQSSAEFRQMMEGWRSTYGNAYARIIPGRQGFAGALEPFHPDEGRPFRLPNGGVAVRWTPQNGQSRILMPGEVLHLKDKPFTRDLCAGQSRVTRHRETIGRAIATCQYLSRFFSNGAVPKTFLQMPLGGELTREQIKLIREQFEDLHGGIENIRRIGVINAGLELKQIGSDNKESDIVEVYGQAVAQLGRIWGVPPHMIGDTDKVTSWGTGIEQQSIGFVTYTMRPKFVVWEQALNAALMSAETGRSYYFEFNVDGLLRGDFKARMEGYALLIQWCVMTINEVRKRENLPPIEGGDERLHPLNFAPASQIMDVLLKTSTTPATRQSEQIDEFTRHLGAALLTLKTGNLDLNGGHA